MGLKGLVSSPGGALGAGQHRVRVLSARGGFSGQEPGAAARLFFPVSGNEKSPRETWGTAWWQWHPGNKVTSGDVCAMQSLFQLHPSSNSNNRVCKGKYLLLLHTPATAEAAGTIPAPVASHRGGVGSVPPVPARDGGHANGRGGRGPSLCSAPEAPLMEQPPGPVSWQALPEVGVTASLARATE